MQVEVTDADRELFITLSNADGQMAERILCGEAFTWEVEQIARHRQAAFNAGLERAAVIAEGGMLPCDLGGDLCLDGYTADTIAAAIRADRS